MREAARFFALAASLACLIAAPAIADNVPLPAPRPLLQRLAPNSTGAVIPVQALRARAQAPAPVTNPFAALLGKAGPSGALTPDQRAIIDKVNAYLSGLQICLGQLRAGRPQWRPLGG